MPPDDPKHLPEANEFSPGVVQLEEVLSLAAEHGGDRAALIEALRQQYFLKTGEKHTDEAKKLKQQTTRAYNVLVGLKGYGLFDLATDKLTPEGEELLGVPSAERNEAFAKHILLRCHGIEVLEAVRSIQSRGETPTKASLQTELEGRGFKLPVATTHHTKVLQWLREGNVLDTKYGVNEEVVAKLTGMGLETLEEWSGLTKQQRAFIRTLRRLGEVYGKTSMPAKDVLTEATYEHGPIFKTDQLAASVYKPLEEKGWITRVVPAEGRGGKSGLIACTDKLLALDLDLLPKDEGWGIPADLRPKLNTPLAEIEANLQSSDKNVKGIALELLALRLATDAALIPLRFRLRAAETGQAEVDLVAEGAHLHSSRWLFQCKNTKSVSLSDLAKEVGMAVLLRAHVIVMVTTGRFASSVETYARELMDTQNLQVVLVDKKVLARYKAGGMHALLDFLHSSAEATMRLKRGQLERHVEAGEV
jgi:hypothetical protein